MQNSEQRIEQNADWTAVMKMYFSLTLTPEESDLWTTEINRRFRNCDNERVCSAIRWASDERNYRRDKMAGKPNVVELIKWIGISKWKEDKDREGANLACSLCGGSGWVAWSREIDDRRDFTFNEYNLSVTTCIPCGCSEGRKTFESTYGVANKKGNTPVNAEEQLQVARQAARQRIIFKRLGDALESTLKERIA